MDYVNDFSNENGFNEALQKVITNLHIYDGEYICLIERRMSQIYELARVFAEKLLFENGENIAENCMTFAYVSFSSMSLIFPLTFRILTGRTLFLR